MHRPTNVIKMIADARVPFGASPSATIMLTQVIPECFTNQVKNITVCYIIVTNKHSSKEVGRSATIESFVVDGFVVSQRITCNDMGRATLRINRCNLSKFSGAPPCENLVEM